MGYSLIKSMRIKNFRNIGDITLDFKESPIISLVGENEAGKTSVIKALTVLGVNAFNRHQKAYIREGTQGFGIAIELEDGTIIQRIKTLYNNQLLIKDTKGEIWKADKIDAGGIPVRLELVMGFIREPETKELIQIRTYEDQLLFVVTPGSTNYKVMYNALKVDQVTKAIREGIDEVNQLKREIVTNEEICRDLNASIRNVNIVDTSALTTLKERLQSKLRTIKLLESAIQIKKRVDELGKQLGAYKDLSLLGEIESVKVDKLVRAIELKDKSKRLGKEIEVYVKLRGLGEIDIRSEKELRKAIELKIHSKKLEESLGAFKLLSTIEEIDINPIRIAEYAIGHKDTLDKMEFRVNIGKMLEGIKEIPESSIDKLNMLEQARLSYSYVYKVIRESKEIEIERVKIQKGLEEYCRERGIESTICPNCGETVVIEHS